MDPNPPHFCLDDHRNLNMSPGNRKKRGNRGSARGGHSDKPNPNKAARHSGDKPTPHTTVNEPASKQATNESLKSPTPNVHPVDEEEDVTAAICWICAEPVRYYSLAACNHRTCHVCALRLRVLYGKLECTFCKVSVLLHSFLVSFLYPCCSRCRRILICLLALSL